MTKLFTLVFSALSLGAVWLTYTDTGMQNIDISTAKSIRQGSSSSSSSYAGGGFYSSGGGYRNGK